MKKPLTFLVIAGTLFNVSILHAQDSLANRMLTLNEAFTMAMSNSTQLKISEKNVQQANQQVEISKLSRLPGISSDLNYGYISNADIWTPSFSKHETESIPHQFTQFSALAAETIFSGGEIENTIKNSKFEEQVASLTLEKNKEDVKLLVAAKYLDIFRLIKQRQVYLNNIILTEHRLKNVLTMQRQGMVTENDVLRTQLTISDFKLALRRINNNIDILNEQLNIVIGVADSSRLNPDSNLIVDQHHVEKLDYFLGLGYRDSHELKIAAIENRIAETNLKIIGSDNLPRLSLYATSNLQRPFIYSLPAIDIYYNIWQVGLTVHYNLSSIYQTKRKIKAGVIQLEESRERELLDKQNLEVEIKANFIKYNEAKDDLITLRSDLRSAEENYRIVEKKYFNQLALLTDMIDATNTKIEAEIKVTTAQINVVYTYCQLLKTTGTL